jgi:hypothetical protein
MKVPKYFTVMNFLETVRQVFLLFFTASDNDDNDHDDDDDRECIMRKITSNPLCLS